MKDWFSKLEDLFKCGDCFHLFLQQVDLMQQANLLNLLESGMAADRASAFMLKISNYIISKFQYIHRHKYLISNPYALVVDPSNNCPLHCSGCLHNKVFRKKIGSDWPGGGLEQNIYRSFINRFGPYASTVLFYNWGEPLLNKHTPSFIRQAKSYLLETSLSSNLSVKFDAEALVLSGLDYMILSIDGATPEVYGRYRQGGEFDLVIDNVRRLVAAKKKYNLSTPVLSWQFLLFEHNKHEMNLVKKMACELGVNEVSFVRPYDVIWEPDLQIAKDTREETFIVPEPSGGDEIVEMEIASSFLELVKHKWLDKIDCIDEMLFAKRSGSTCQWLYSSLVMDACGRCLPCCYVPRKDSGYTWIFAEPERLGSFDDEAMDNFFNSEYHCFSRHHFVWLSELEKSGGIAPRLGRGKSVPYCVACPDKNLKPLVNSFHLHRYLHKFGKIGLLTEDNIRTIVDWD